MTNPLLIGITGGIASGKSTIATVFQHLGVPVYEADDRAKRLMNEDLDLKDQIISAFGEQSYGENGLNRRYLAETVFKDSEAIEKLNGFVHPAVGRDFRRWVSINQDAPYVLKEAALLFDTGSFKTLDRTILVYASDEIRLKRVQKRDPFRKENEVRAIMGRQMPEEEKRLLADYEVVNDESALVIPQVLDLHNIFLGLKKNKS